jgi:hypothetical protein
MLDVMDGRRLLGTLKPVSTGGFECFDATGRYVGKIYRVGEAVALLRAALQELQPEPTNLERSEHIAEWVRLAEKQSLQVATKGHRPESGVNKAARELGIEQTDAHRSVKVAGLTDEAKDAARPPRARARKCATAATCSKTGAPR